MHKSRLGCVIIDCKTDNLDGDAEFWGRVFGADVERSDKPENENYRKLASSPAEPALLLQKVSHPSRVHIDIETDNIDLEVKRLVGLGAKELERIKGWCVLEAPSGHRFCVVKKQREGFDDNANVWE